MRSNNRKANKGFTLIELMIVVAIIGILAAVALPKFADLVTRSKEASVKGSLGAVRSAVSIYYSDTEGEFPTSLFDGLTSANKYMPAVQGTGSLGRYAIPKNNATVATVARTTGFFANLSGTGGVRETNGLDPDNSATVVLNYSTGSTTLGDIVVNVTTQDTKGVAWSFH